MFMHISNVQSGIAILLTVLVLSPAGIGLAVAQADVDSTEPVSYETAAGLQPSVIVEYSDRSALAAWANESGNRELVEMYPAANQSVIAAPAWVTQEGDGLLASLQHIQAGGIDALTTAPLETESFVEAVYPNYRVSLPERPDALTVDSFNAPTDAFTIERLAPSHPTEGMAFADEVNTTTLDEATDTIGADNVTAPAPGQDIAVIDTGANTANGRLFGNGTAGSPIRIVNASKNLITNESVNVSSGNYDAIADGSDSLHGTWTAAAAAGSPSNASYRAIANESELLVLKALKDSGSGSTADIAAAIRYAADQDADVISMSLGAPLSNPALREAIDYAHDNGVQAVVAAAGNSRVRRGANIASPADYGPVITVGATTTNDSAADVRSAFFSQAGPDPGTTDNSRLKTAGAMPDVAAPGFKIELRVADSSGNVIARQLSGTSMSTPSVASGVAAAFAQNATLASAENGTVHESVTASARSANDTARVEVGHGVFAADNLIDGTTPATSQTEAMSESARQRQAFYESNSDAQGGIFADFLGMVG